jgi:hypothetical protein
MLQSKPVAPAAPIAQAEPVEFQGGVGGLFIVDGQSFRQVGTLLQWKLTYEFAQAEMLGVWQQVTIEAEQLWLREMPQQTMNILLFRNNLIYVIARAFIEGIKDVEEQKWMEQPTPWDGFQPGPWIIRSDLMVPPIPGMKSGSWDRAVKENDLAKQLEILTLAEAWERMQKERMQNARQ